MHGKRIKTERREGAPRRSPFGALKGRRAVSLLLSVVLFLSVFFSVAVYPALSAAGDDVGGTQGVSREADPSTMDTYREMLDFLKDSRYAGRLWTDKTVFALGKPSRVSLGSNLFRGFDGKKLRLLDALDGLDGFVTLDADFLEVFSALGSSVAIDEFPSSPIDLVIVIDMSASMGQDTRYGIDTGGANYETHKDGNDNIIGPGKNEPYEWPSQGVPMQERIVNSRIKKTLDAINDTIDRLMAQNKQNRVAVVGYGAGACVIMPLAHYQKNGDKPYLSVGGMETLYHPGDLNVVNVGTEESPKYEWRWINNRDTCYTVVADCKQNLDDIKSDDPNDGFTSYTKTVSNNVNNKKVHAFPGVGVQTVRTLAESAAQHSDLYDKLHNSQGNINDDSNLKTLVTGTVRLGAGETPGTVLPNTSYVGYYTNTQGGIYLGLKQLAEASTTFTDTLKSNNATSVTVPRIPAAIIMSDGGANFAFNEMAHWDNRSQSSDGKYYGSVDIGDDGKYKFADDQRSNADPTDNSHRLKVGETGSGNVGDEWYNVFLPGTENECEITSLYNTGMENETGRLNSAPGYYHAGVFYSSDNNIAGTPGTNIEVLMTASYMKTAVDKHYKAGWDKAKIPDERRRDLQVFTLSVDSHNVPQWGRWRLYPTLDPKNYFLDSSHWKEWDKFGEGGAGGTYGGQVDKVLRRSMLDVWNGWRENPLTGNMGIKANMAGSSANSKTQVFIFLKSLPKDGYSDPNFHVTITNQDVVDNIVYNDGFYDVESAQLDEIFDIIFSRVVTPIFTPVTGQNDLGVSNSVTFMDPIGKYMEVKSVKNLLLFGTLYGISKTAVYSYSFNSASENKGSGLLKEGWYKGSDPTNAVYQKEVPSGFTAEAAWKAGWVYRINAETASKYVPSLADINSADGENAAVQKMRQTEYTFYRVSSEYTFDANDPNKDPIIKEYAQDSAEFTRWRLNPAYGEEKDGVPVDGNRAGAYRLSDLRIWVEDTGDYVDTSLGSGGLQTDSSYDTALWIDVPRYMLPLRTVTVSQDEKGDWTYKTNIPADGRKDKITPNSPESAAFPLRVFYTVGVADDMLDSTGRINISRLGQEYLQKNKINTDVASLARGFKENGDPAGTGIGNIEFFSNWYNPENRYADYVTSQTQYSYGDPAATFSPSTDNRYYIFQNGLPLYKAAYEYVLPGDGGGGTGTWKQVVIEESKEESKDGEATRTKFVRDIVAQDLEVHDTFNPANPTDEIETALNPLSKTPKGGDIVLLKQDRIKDVTSEFPAENEYYFMPIEYFVVEHGASAPAATGPEDTGVSADLVSKCVTRQGAEFGSAHVSSGISNEDMLCWYDASGTFKEVYPFLTDDSETFGNKYIGYSEDYIRKSDGSLKTPEELKNDGIAAFFAQLSQTLGDWVVAAKPGALRVGDLAEAAKPKTVEERIYDKVYPSEVSDVTFNLFGKAVGGSDWAYQDSDHDKDYTNERFPDKSDDQNFQVHYYNGNVTRTSNTYYMPTARSRVLTDTAEPVSLIDAADAPGGTTGSEKGVVINTYLGNNGRLWVMDTTLLVTKLVEPPAGMKVDPQQEFHFQVFINGFSGDVDAIVVKYDETTKRWHRQFHYIDLLLDQKLFLRNSDGSPALVDGDGKHIIATTNDGVMSYKYEDGNEYKGTPYYVFIGKNKNDVDVGENGDVLRLYHNTEVHGNDLQYHEVSEDVVKRVVDDRTGVTTYSVVNVWLFTEEQYGSFQLNEDGSYTDPTTETATKKIGDFEVLTVSPAEATSNAPTEMLFNTPYATQSAYYTKTVHFGAPDDDEHDGTTELYDSTIIESDVWPDRAVTNDKRVNATATFTLKSGEGLLFTGIPDNVPYLVTERQERTPGGYRFESVTHNLLNPGSPDYPTQNAAYAYKEKNGNPDPVGPTAHFDGGGAYSVYDTTSTYEEAAHYVNTLAKPSLAVEKRIGDDKPNTEAEFTFRVTLTAPSGGAFSKDDIDLLHFKLYNRGDTDDTEDPDFTQPVWMNDKGTPAAGGESIIYAEFKLTHNQKIVLYDIPDGSTYVVAETDGGDYLLQRVEDGYGVAPDNIIPESTENPDANPTFAPSDDGSGLGSVTGTVTYKAADGYTEGQIGEPDVYLIFYNYLKYGLPTTGGAGARPLFAAGAALLLCAGVLSAVKLCRKAKRKNKTEER